MADALPSIPDLPPPGTVGEETKAETAAERSAEESGESAMQELLDAEDAARTEAEEHAAALRETDDATLVRHHLDMKKLRDEAKRSWERFEKPAKARAERVEAEMLRRMNDRNLDAFSVKGLARVERRQTPRFNVSAADFPDFWEYVKSNDRSDMVSKRPLSDAVKQYIEENGGKAPPGVKQTIVQEVRVVKASGKATP